MTGEIQPLSVGGTTLQGKEHSDQTFYAGPACRAAFYNEGEHSRGVNFGAWDGTQADIDPAQDPAAALAIALALAARRGMRVQFRLVRK